MKFPELEIENFLGITSAKINLADRGLVAIQGMNHADTSGSSNGASKSSIPDALCWAWFGTTARGETGDDVVNNLTGKNCMVKSIMLDDHMTYTVTRYRKHKTGKNRLHIVAHDGFKETDLTKGTDKLTQEVVNKIIGSSLEVFAGSIYAGQEQMPDLPAMTDKNLKVLIEEAAGVTVLEGAYRKAREEHQTATWEHTKTATNIQGVTDKLAFIDNQIVSTKTSVDLWETNKVARLASLKTDAGLLVAEIKRLNAEITAADGPGLEAKIAACDAQIAGVSGEQVELNKLNGNLNHYASELRRETDLRDYASREVDKARTALAGVSHQIGCPCAQCGRPLTPAELKAATDNANLAVTRWQEDLVQYQINVESLEKAHASALSARDAFYATLTDTSAVAAQRASLAALHTTYQTLVTLQQTTLEKARALKDQITRLSAEENPHIAQLAALEAQRQTLSDDLVVLQTRLDLDAKKVELEAEVVKLYSPAGVRAQILDEVTPFLNTQTAKYLSTMSDGNMEATWSTLTANAKGELKENFSIAVTNETGGGKFGLLSGGEKRKARIATALALQDLVSTRASKPIELFIGDEIDDALDPAGLERLMIILEEKARERGSVFVISHNELRDHIKQVLLIEKMPDRTTKVSEVMA